MSEFELYIMIFYSLDYYWKEHKSEELGMYLSGMNPFLFDGEGSAVPDYYLDYQKFIAGREITIENSFDIAKEFIYKLKRNYVTEAFGWVEKEEWVKRCKKLVDKTRSV